MIDVDKVVQLVLKEIEQAAGGGDGIPAGVSNRHVHLSEEDLKTLFGDGAALTVKKELSQPGQFAAEECVTLVGPKGCMDKVRVLGPTRFQTQVEVLASDCFKLGIDAPVRESGKLEGTPGIAVVGPNGCVQLQKGVIIAQRHIHMAPSDAERFGRHHGEIVSIRYEGIRGGVLSHVMIRVSDTSRLDFHLDIDEANCLGIKDRDKITIEK